MAIQLLKKYRKVTKYFLEMKKLAGLGDARSPIPGIAAMPHIIAFPASPSCIYSAVLAISATAFQEILKLIYIHLYYANKKKQKLQKSMTNIHYTKN